MMNKKCLFEDYKHLGEFDELVGILKERLAIREDDPEWLKNAKRRAVFRGIYSDSSFMDEMLERRGELEDEDLEYLLGELEEAGFSPVFFNGETSNYYVKGSDSGEYAGYEELVESGKYFVDLSNIFLNSNNEYITVNGRLYTSDFTIREWSSGDLFDEYILKKVFEGKYSCVNIDPLVFYPRELACKFLSCYIEDEDVLCVEPVLECPVSGTSYEDRDIYEGRFSGMPQLYFGEMFDRVVPWEGISCVRKVELENPPIALGTALFKFVGEIAAEDAEIIRCYVDKDGMPCLEWFADGEWSVLCGGRDSLTEAYMSVLESEYVDRDEVSAKQLKECYESVCGVFDSIVDEGTELYVLGGKRFLASSSYIGVDSKRRIFIY